MIGPKLRFKRDDGTAYPAWEANQLGNIASYLKGAPLSKSDICDDGTPLILYGELYTTYGEVTTDIVRRTKKTVSDEYLSRVGDVLIPTSGETPEEISTATCVMVPGVILAGDLYIVRNNALNGCVLSFILNYQVNGDIAKIAQGKSIVHLRWDDLKKIVIKYPFDIEEQQKIAAFLSALDEVIAASEKEVAALEQQKKGAMQKIFSQEIRFKRDDGSEYPEWTLVKLADIATRVTRRNTGNVSDIPLTISSAYGFVDQRSFFNKTVASENMENYYLLMNGEFGYNKSSSKGYDFGAIKRLDGFECGALSTLYICFALNEAVDSDYMTYYFDSQKWNKEASLRCAEGARNHGLLNISAADFFDMSLCLASDIEEQQKIADFLSSFDEALALARQELEHWKLLKKGLMQQMFV